ncbi:DUF1775 domain-containing protein, partial (plasmid) [Arthrobacter sp. TES]
MTKHIGQIVYTAQTPLEDGYRAAFEIQVQNPDQAGETLAFPTLQTCEKGETDWAELLTEGLDPHELEAPAPTYTLTAASDTGHVDGTEDPASLEDIAQASQAGDNSTTIPAYTGLAARIT